MAGQKATLIKFDDQGGFDRIEVEAGSQEAQTSFGEGFVLETPENKPPEIKEQEITQIQQEPTTDDVVGGEEFLPPETSAEAIETAFVEGQTATVETQKENLANIFKAQQEEAEREMEALKEEIEAFKTKEEEIIEKADPKEQEFFKEETEIARNRVEAARVASATLVENFTKNQKSIKELESILTMANRDIQAEKTAPGLRNVKFAKINKAREEALGRVGIIQAVMSARDGQINMANNLINQAFTTINARRTDTLNYYNSLLSFYGERKDVKNTALLKVTEEQKKAVENQIGIVLDNIAEAQKSKDAIIKLMESDPEMVEQAGINLTDSIETITKKRTKWEKTFGGVRELREQYPDAGILSTDTLEQARAKLPNSKIYRKATRLVGGSGGRVTTDGVVELTKEDERILVAYGFNDTNDDFRFVFTNVLNKGERDDFKEAFDKESTNKTVDPSLFFEQWSASRIAEESEKETKKQTEETEKEELQNMSKEDFEEEFVLPNMEVDDEGDDIFDKTNVDPDVLKEMTRRGYF